MNFLLKEGRAKKFRESFAAKVYAVVTVFIILVSVVFVTIIVRGQYKQLMENSITKGTLLAKLLAYNSRLGVFSESETILTDAVDAIKRQNDVVYVSIYNSDAKLLTKYVNGQLYKDTSDDHNEIDKIIEQLKKEKSLFFTEGKNVLCFWAPVLSDYAGDDYLQVVAGKSKLLGFVEICLTTTTLKAQIIGLFLRSILMSVFFLLIALSITFVILRKIIRPVIDLTSCMREFGETGTLTGELPITAQDEIGHLSMAFTKMIDDLHAKENEKHVMEEHLINSQKMEAIGTLAGGIAHNFNNVLTVFASKLAVAKNLLPKTHDAYARLIQAEDTIGKAKYLSNQLFTFARGGSPIKEAASIGSLIEETVPLIMAGSRLNYELEIAEDLCLAMIDKDQMRQVINNLLSNSKDAVKDRGSITVRARNAKLTDHIAVPSNGMYIKIDFMDTGIGIIEDNLSKIFTPFFTTKRNGRGLGLTIAHSIVKKHGGEVIITSEHGKWTLCEVYVPATCELGATVAIESAKTSDFSISEPVEVSAAEQKRILLLEDNDEIRTWVGLVLRDSGYRVSMARDGLEALYLYNEGKLQGQPFDVVVVDLVIEDGMGGKEAMEELLKADPDVKAIVASGYSDDPVMAEYKRYGFKACVSKPYGMDQLLDAIEFASDTGR
ncbi:hybrid sensor histidine kinase/response regulator [Candidatus Magnetomonas plexicatena]|uniref:hybrid sensor histidine kinase/response regulator n=1 Tax=Candidatus Magnetomonas plexicatena TaxID=2552947 RepID=UPI001C7939CC|nr:response regulator [Nitrospirales bacterium LBB_01]